MTALVLVFDAYDAEITIEDAEGEEMFHHETGLINLFGEIPLIMVRGRLSVIIGIKVEIEVIRKDNFVLNTNRLHIV